MTQTNLAIKKLKGIKPKGVKVKDKSTFELLLKGYGTYVNLWGSGFFSGDLGCTHIPLLISDDLENTLFKDVEFNKKHLEDFIIVSAAFDVDGTKDLFRGLYSGALLTLCSKRLKQQGKKAEFCFNGDGLIYPYLFHGASHMDVLVLRNFNGRYIGNFINNFDKEFPDRPVILLTNVFGIYKGAFSNDNCVGVLLNCGADRKSFETEYPTIDSARDNFLITVGHSNMGMDSAGYHLFLPKYGGIKSSRVEVGQSSLEGLKLEETRALLLNSTDASDEELLTAARILKSKYDKIYENEK
ncbi:hypothetical protein HOK51_07845 [Candidatus Woesearchaeota archaeon]|jgi:hypothetical protein|nr:hypothetical protein [Candidatus Woesearchaeota archaeon]MBT6519737.1 hypothetical protein [Candidatus Woesearchaeota archaeon]MBT7368117.1 hypothetical protein [Candidatus Woesearchaeota archaeon]